MSLEQFKTQVLLLYGRHAPLNQLGTEFGAQYAVHYATSGNEALDTLRERPIEVFIAALDLDGTDGLTVLREARKSSPATIGILMVHGDHEDLLTTLGEGDELFQIIRGEISGDTLSDLIDSATKRVNFLTAAESEIATAADDSSSEHIVMETSECGIAVVSSGSGPEPVLKSAGFSVSATAGGREVAILVLTTNDNFLATIRTAAQDLHIVHHASTPVQAAEVARSHEIGVFIADTATTNNSIDVILKKLRVLKFGIVTIVAGQRDDGEMLMDYVNRGHIYRFLLEPVSAGRARLAIESSVSHYLDTRPQRDAITAPATQSNSLGSTLNEVIHVAPSDELLVANHEVSANTDQNILVDNSGQADGKIFPGSTAIYVIAGTGVTGIVITLWLLVGGSSGPDQQLSGEDSATSVPEIKVAMAEPAVPALVAEALEAASGMLTTAREARAAGKLVSGDKDNAVLLYLEAVSAPYQNDKATAELLEVIDEAIVFAETALLEARLQDAAIALKVISIASPDNARLIFLIAQMAQLEDRAILDNARMAVRERRFDDAEELLYAAETRQVMDSPALAALNNELASGRRQQKVGNLLAEAERHMNAGLLISPPNSNARYFYQLALENDSGNAVARQGLILVAGKLVAEIRSTINSGSFAEAEAFIDEIRRIDPEYSELASLVSELDRAIESRQAEVAREAKAARLAMEARRAVLRGEAVGSFITDPSEPVVSGFQAEGEQTIRQNTKAGIDSSAAGQPNALKRTHYVAPVYPPRAARNNITGWVDLSFLVGVTGEVTLVEVIDAAPRKTFSAAAIRAAEQWRFQPAVMEGRPVEKRVTIRMVFTQEN